MYHQFIRKSLVIAALLITGVDVGLFAQTVDKSSGSFTFAFMTDIHLTPTRNAVAGFRQAIDSVNALKPDFVITGGDLIMDALEQKYHRADSLYRLYAESVKQFNMPVHNTLGNHEIFGIITKSAVNPNHPEYGEKMFEKRLGPSYYTFEHRGWKFFILNSVEDSRKNGYLGWIDEEQMDWIRKELKHTSETVPLAISTHIPLLTASTQYYEGSTKASDSGTVVANARKVLDLFRDHNLKLVLQGHLHLVEDIYIDGIHFITGGAVSAGWWGGPYLGCEEGFMLLNVRGEDISWKYVDYGWKAR
jgi:3',5'-cyclic AMP phosphodiesterase CpdA